MQCTPIGSRRVTFVNPNNGKYPPSIALAATCRRAMPALVVGKVVNHIHRLHRAIDHERGLFHSVCETCTRPKR